MIVAFIIFVALVFSINYYVRADGYHGPVSDHFDGTRFRNFSRRKKTPIHKTLISIFDSVHFLIDSLRHPWDERILPHGEAVPAERVYGKEIVATFVNHSTVLIQTEGLNILTDPVWAKRASPFSFFGPKRYMPPGVSMRALPHIDMILLSHNHYDHMDIAALKQIAHRDSPVIYTSLGNSAYLNKWGIYGAYDMDWGDKKHFSEMISIHCVPSQHFSARGLSDRNKTLWCGFVIRTPHGDIYFAGDNGYGVFVSHIKKMFPEGFRLAFLPIGAYKPEYMMKEVHMGPYEALQVYRRLNISKAITIHMGTFDLALDGQDEPKEIIKHTLAREEYADVDMVVPYNGEVIRIE